MACYRRFVAVGVVLAALVCSAMSPRASAVEALPNVTLDLKRAPLDDVLKVLFHGTPYAFDLEPGDYARVTISLENTPWADALRAVLDMEGLTATVEGNVYHIAGRGSGAKAPPAPAPAKPVHTMVYLSPYGDRTQLCLRQFPYPGYERVLWESRPGERVMYYSPSPSFTRVLLVTDGGQLLVSVPDGEELPLFLGRPFLFWKDNGEFTVVDYDRWQQQWVRGGYDPDTDTLTPTEALPADTQDQQVLETQFADRIRAVTDLVTSGTNFGVELKAEDAPEAVLRAMGFWMHDVTVGQPLAAVAPDGKHFALTSGKEKVVVITKTGERSYEVTRVLPATSLLKEEAVAFQHLRWSPDSKSLTYTERHFYPAQYYAPDIGRGYKVPTNVTSLVRLYDTEKDDVQTIVVGGNAFLAAEGVEFQPR